MQQAENKHKKQRSLWSRWLRSTFYPYPDTEVRVAWLIKPHGYHDDDHEDAIEESFGYYGMAVVHRPDPLEDLSDQLWAEFRAGWPLDEGVVHSSSASISCFVLSFIVGMWFLAGSLFLSKRGIWSPILVRMAIALPCIGLCVMVCGYVQHRKELSEERKEYLESLAGAFRKEGFIVDYGHKRFGYHYARFRHIDGSKFDHHGDRHLRLNALGEYLVVFGLMSFGLSAILMIFFGLSIVQVIDEDLDGYHGWAVNSEAKESEYNIEWAPVVLDGTLFELKYSNPDFEIPVELSRDQRDTLGAQNLIVAQAFAIGAYFSMLLFFVSFCRMPHEWDRHVEHTESERTKHCNKLRQFHALITAFSFSWAVFLSLYQISIRGSNFCGPHFIEMPFDLNSGIGNGAVIHQGITSSCRMGYICLDILGMSWVGYLLMLIWWLMEEEWGILSGDHDVATNDELKAFISHLSMAV